MLPIAKIYEAFAFVAALYLCIFLLVWSTDWATQVQYFSLPENKGFTFFRRRYILVTQILPSLTILSVAEIIIYALKCAQSRDARVAHIVVGVLDAVVIISAITGMLPFLRAHSTKLKGAESTLWGKLLVFKGIVFIQMIQSLILSIVSFTNAFYSTKYLSYNDGARGLNPFISCCVILLLSLMMIYYYDPRRHGTSNELTHSGKPGDYYHQVQLVGSGQTVVDRIVNPKMPVWRALWDSINMTDVLVGMGRASKLLFKKNAFAETTGGVRKEGPIR